MPRIPKLETYKLFYEQIPTKKQSRNEKNRPKRRDTQQMSVLATGVGVGK